MPGGAANGGLVAGGGIHGVAMKGFWPWVVEVLIIVKRGSGCGGVAGAMGSRGGLAGTATLWGSNSK